MVASGGGGGGEERADVRNEIGDTAVDIFAALFDEGEEVGRDTDEDDADEELNDPSGDVDGLAPVVCELLHGGGCGGGVIVVVVVRCC